MASVHERPLANGDVTYRVMFRLASGKQKQESFVHRAGAEEFRMLVEKIGGDAALHVLQLRRDKKPETPTIAEWTARYLDPDSGLLTGVEDGTRRGYRESAGRSFLPMLGAFPVDAVQKVDVGRWVAWQEKQPALRGGGRTIAAKTVRNYHAILSAVLASAVAEGLRTDNPAYRTRLTRGTKKEATFLTPEEFATILHFTPSRHEAFLLFLAGSGCRWGEATAVTWGALNLTAATPTVRIDKAWKRGPTSAPILKQPKSVAGRRTISLSPDVVAALGTPGAPGDLVFPGQTGNHLWYSGFRENVWVPTIARAQNVELCEAAGLTPLRKTPTPHALRHSHASWLIAAGTPLPYVQARLGHESITTTISVYSHLVPEAHSQMADIIGSTLIGVRPLRQVKALTP